MFRFAIIAALCVGCSSSEFELGAANDAAVDGAAPETAGDTLATETTTADAPAPDALPDTREAGVCPRPRSTSGPPPVSGLTCDDLLAKYEAAIQKARACECDEDCSVVIDTDWCDCKANVSPANTAYVHLQKYRQQFESLECTRPGCGITPCAPPLPPKCLLQVDGTRACN